MKNIKIKAGSFTNKGDMLMFLAIVKKIKNYGRINVEYGRLTFAESKKYNVFFSQSRGSIKGLRIGQPKAIKRIIVHILNYFPQWLLIKFRFIPDHKIDVLLDASGYAYGDYWGEEKINKAIKEYKSLKNARKIILPQSLGPFEKEETINSFKDLAVMTEIIYARDASSFKYAEKITPSHKKIKQAPDFTFYVEPVKPTYLNLPNKYVAIIPNHRLVMSENDGDLNLYLEFLKTSVDVIKKTKFEPVFVAHDIAHDTFIIKALEEKLGYNVISVVEQDVQKIRWVIKNSIFTISSRFHGMINALTQCVPVIGMGWTHKYKHLALEYGVERFLIEPNITKNEVEKLITELSVDESRNKVIEQIKLKRDQQKKYSDSMWNELIEIINS